MALGNDRHFARFGVQPFGTAPLLAVGLVALWSALVRRGEVPTGLTLGRQALDPDWMALGTRRPVSP
jgi:hypothetical protein